MHHEDELITNTACSKNIRPLVLIPHIDLEKSLQNDREGITMSFKRSFKRNGKILCAIRKYC